jgi:toxin FitB
VTFLVDTNVISELVKPRPDPGVVQWIDGADENRVFLSVVTVAEFRHGIVRMPAGRRRRRLMEWFYRELPLRFEGRILAIDEDTAIAWGDVTAERAASGRPIGAMDAFIAATARVHGLELVTRNIADFEGSVAATINPWQPD